MRSIGCRSAFLSIVSILRLYRKEILLRTWSDQTLTLLKVSLRAHATWVIFSRLKLLLFETLLHCPAQIAYAHVFCKLNCTFLLAWEQVIQVAIAALRRLVDLSLNLGLVSWPNRWFVLQWIVIMIGSLRAAINERFAHRARLWARIAVIAALVIVIVLAAARFFVIRTHALFSCLSHFFTSLTDQFDVVLKNLLEDLKIVEREFEQEAVQRDVCLFEATEN